MKTMNNDVTDPTILFEDNHVIVVLKPQNLASCPDESGDGNLLDALKEYIRAKNRATSISDWCIGSIVRRAV